MLFRSHKRKYRVIDFKREKENIPAKVASIEYDPNRTARIALLVYADGEKRYIVAPIGLTVGQTIESGKESLLKSGIRCICLKSHWVQSYITLSYVRDKEL